MPTQAAAHTRHQRVLLLIAAGTAGIGISLSIADDAHASDHDHTGLVEGATAVVTDTVDTTLDRPHRHPGKPSKPRQQSKPQPVRELVDHTTSTATRAVTDTTTAVKDVTDRADTATRDLPAVGDTVDKATDLTDRVLDTAPKLVDPPTPPRPPDVQLHPVRLPTPSVIDPAPGGQPTTGAHHPEPALAAQHPALAAQHPAAAQPHTPNAATPHRGQPTATTAAHHAPANPDVAPCGHHTTPAAADNTNHPAATPANRCTINPTHGDPIPGPHRDHTGRTWPPTPPSG